MMEIIKNLNQQRVEKRPWSLPPPKAAWREKGLKNVRGLIYSVGKMPQKGDTLECSTKTAIITYTDLFMPDSIRLDPWLSWLISGQYQTDMTNSFNHKDAISERTCTFVPHAQRPSTNF